MWPRPIQGQFVILRLGLAMINLHTKFEVSIVTHYEDIKHNTKCINRSGLGVRGHPMSPAISPCDRAHTSFYSTSMGTTWYASIFYHFQVIMSYLSNVAYFNLLLMHLAPRLGWPHSNFAETFGVRKWVPGLSCGIVSVILHLAILT